MLARHGWFSGFIDADYERAQRDFERALSIAEREDDSALERRTLANAAFVDAFHLRWGDCLAKGLRAIELAQGAGDATPRSPPAEPSHRSGGNGRARAARASAARRSPTRSSCARTGGSRRRVSATRCCASTRATGEPRAR